MIYEHREKCLVCCQCKIHFWLFFFLHNILLYHWTQRPNQRSSYWNQNIESESLRKSWLCCSKPGCGSRKFYFFTFQGMKGLLVLAEDLFLLEARWKIIMQDIFSWKPENKLLCKIFFIGHVIASVSILLWKKNKNIYHMVYPCCPINHW